MKNSYNEQKLAIKKALAGVVSEKIIRKMWFVFYKWIVFFIKDTVQKSNKIVFEDASDEENNTLSVKKASSADNQIVSKEKKSSAKKPNLFDEDEDSNAEENYVENFEIKQQFEGKKGERLRRLQDRFQGDNRFKMDSKFLEDESEGSGDEKSTKQKHQQKTEKSNDDIETNENDERQWQLNILESVIGKKVHTKSKQTQK